MAIYYAIAGWGLLQVADIVIGLLDLPGWTLRFTLIVIVLCFPLALMLSWMFRLTPKGIEREDAGAPAASRAPQTGEVPGVGVMPLRLSGGPTGDAYLAIGLSEEIMRALARLGTLRLPSRRSCLSLGDQEADIGHAAQRLGVDYLLRGTLDDCDGGCKAAIELVSASDDRILWSNKRDYRSDELARLPDDVALGVADALGVSTDAKARRPGPPSREAFHDYLRAQHEARSGTADGQRRAVELFERAIALEPGYAQAWAGLSHAYSWLARYGVIPFADTFRRARNAAERALELDAGLADAYLALADDSLFGRRDFRGAESALRRALELEPGNAEIHRQLAHYLGLLCRWEEALAVRERALELDPLAITGHTGYADTLFLAGRHEAALRQLDRVAEIAPEYPTFHLRARIALALGRPEQALEQIRGERLEWRRLYISAIAYHRLGETGRARADFSRLVSQYGDDVALQAAIVLAQFGEPDAAFDWLETAIEKEDPGIVELMADPELEPLREDPRFPGLLERVGFGSAAEPRDVPAPGSPGSGATG